MDSGIPRLAKGASTTILDTIVLGIALGLFALLRMKASDEDEAERRRMRDWSDLDGAL